MSTLMHIGWLVIGLMIFGFHHYLSSRRHVWLGAIIPALYVIAVLIFFTKYHVTFFSRDNYPFAFIFIFLLSDWIYGYGSYKKREKQELDKMKGKDLK